MKNIWENFTSNICRLRLKVLFFMKMNCDIFVQSFLEGIATFSEMKIWKAYEKILFLISAHLGHKILNSRNSELRLQAYSSNPVEKLRFSSFLHGFLSSIFWLFGGIACYFGTLFSPFLAFQSALQKNINTRCPWG